MNNNDNKNSFAEFAKTYSSPEEPEGFLGTLKEYGKTAVKGGIEGFVRLGEMMSRGYQTPQFEGGKLIPPKTQEEREKERAGTLEEILPTGEESVGQKALGRSRQTYFQDFQMAC